jgi:hypothetical protein
VTAERHVAGRLDGVEPEAGLEPLAVRVDQAHQRDRHAEQPAGEPCDPVEALLRRRVEHVQRMQGAQAGRFVDGNGRGRHRISPFG